jgi:short-subunit dehydrogenase
MDLLQIIINYHQGEARHGFWAAVIGGLLLIGGLMLLKWASSLSLLKGFSVPMLLFGLLLGIGGGADGIYTHRAAPGKITRYQNDSSAFLKQEKVKVEKTHRGWKGIRILWGLLGLSGLALSLLITKPFWIGAGLGTLALTVIISIFEFYSMRFNEWYYHAIQTATVQGSNTFAKDIDSNALPQVIVPQRLIGVPNHKQTSAKPTVDTLQPKIIAFDSLQRLSVPSRANVLLSDSINFNISNRLQLSAWRNETIAFYYHDKKSKIKDDKISGHRLNVKHCGSARNIFKTKTKQIINNMKKVALVTGASAGIGAATARLLAQCGYTVYGVARRIDKMEALNDLGIKTIAMDVADDVSMVMAVEQIINEQGRIDILVNSAGFGSYGAVEDVSMEDARYQLEVNVIGLARLCQLVLPHMREQHFGKIINITSIGGKMATPLGGWYHASKFAVEGLSDSMRLEVKPFGVDVIIIEPGGVKTEWGGIAFDSAEKTSGHTVYGGLTSKAKSVFAKSEVNNVEPTVIAVLIKAAIEKKSPKPRYAKGYMAGTILLAKKWLSDSMFDKMLMSQMK